MSEQVIIKAGNSLAITIPASFSKQIGLLQGQEVTITTFPEEGKLVIEFPKRMQLPLTT